MKPARIFSIASPLAFAGWCILGWMLFLDPDSLLYYHLLYIVGGIILLFCISYVFLMISGRKAFVDGGYSSLEKVMALFRHEKATLSGWVHFLAFDLIVGCLVVLLGHSLDINPFLQLPVLILTFLFGPAGLLVFAIIILFTQHSFNFF